MLSEWRQADVTSCLLVGKVLQVRCCCSQARAVECQSGWIDHECPSEGGLTLSLVHQSRGAYAHTYTHARAHTDTHKHEQIQQLLLEQPHEAAVSPSRAWLPHSQGLWQANTHPCLHTHTNTHIPHAEYVGCMCVAHKFQFKITKKRECNICYLFSLKGCVIVYKLRWAGWPSVHFSPPTTDAQFAWTYVSLPNSWIYLTFKYHGWQSRNASFLSAITWYHVLA